MLKKLLYIFIIAFSINSVNAQLITLLNENFNNGFPLGWTKINNDGLIPAAPVAFVNEAWVVYPDLDSTSIDDSLVVATSYYSPAGKADDWLITPPITLKARGNYLSWQVKSQDPSFPDGYDVFISNTLPVIDSFYQTDTIFFTDFEYDTWTNRTKLIDDIFANQTIYIAFHAKSDDQFLLLVDNISVYADTLLTVKENPILPITKIYPNPCTDFIQIETIENALKYNVISIQGQILLSGNIQNKRQLIDISNLPKGTYIVRTDYTNNVSVFNKIIKN